MTKLKQIAICFLEQEFKKRKEKGEKLIDETTKFCHLFDVLAGLSLSNEKVMFINANTMPKPKVGVNKQVRFLLDKAASLRFEETT